MKTTTENNDNRAWSILHVEDSEDDALLVQAALRGKAPTIRRVDNEEAYLAALDSSAPDAVVCDYHMPRFSAERALEILGERGLDIPFLIVSNHIDQSDAVVAMQNGASDYLPKKNLRRLPKAIESAIERAQARRQKAAAEEALKESEATLRGILDSLDPRIALLQADGTIRAVNKAWADFDETRGRLEFGAAVAGRDYLHMLDLAAERGDAFARAGASAVRALIRGDVPTVSLDYQITVGGTQRWYVARADPLEGSAHGVVVSHRDVTDQMMSHVALDAAHKRLQALSKRVLSIQEEERRAISTELHDGIGQSVAALKMGLYRISQAPSADHSTLVAECLAIADSTLESLRRVALELRPPQLEQLGLAPALDWLAQRQQAATGLAIECACTTAEGWRASHALESACYRIAQEALNNATKHANASSIRIALDASGELLKLNIHDDGTGFDPEAARHKSLKSGSLGLISMEERAELAGGRLRVRSVAGGGTTVTAIFPVGANVQAHAQDEVPSVA